MATKSKNHTIDRVESIYGNDLKLAGLEKKLAKYAVKPNLKAAAVGMISGNGNIMAGTGGSASSRTKNVAGNNFTPGVVEKQQANPIPQGREDLESMRIVTKILNGKDHAGITLPGFGGISLERDQSSLNVYYIETKVIDTSNGPVVYGCGYSLHYLFKKVARGINISKLQDVAASVQLNSNKTQVQYCMQTYGIIGKKLTKYFKPTVDANFDVEGFGIMQSSIDGIHNILSDEALSGSVKFKPEILHFINAEDLKKL